MTIRKRHFYHSVIIYVFKNFFILISFLFSSENSSSKESEYEESESYEKLDEDSTATSGRDVEERKYYSEVLVTNRTNCDFDESIKETSDLSHKVELKHIVLYKGASRGICLNPIKVTQIIQQHKDKITEKSMQILNIFIKLVKINPFIAKK